MPRSWSTPIIANCYWSMTVQLGVLRAPNKTFLAREFHFPRVSAIMPPS
jgi:hypothetical protein